jgi:hypothetical protein
LVQQGIVMDYTKFFVGAMEYLNGLTWASAPRYACRRKGAHLCAADYVVRTRDGVLIRREAFPLAFEMYGGVRPAAGVSIFSAGDSAGMNYSPSAFRNLSEAFGPEIDHRLGPQCR